MITGRRSDVKSVTHTHDTDADGPHSKPYLNKKRVLQFFPVSGSSHDVMSKATFHTVK